MNCGVVDATPAVDAATDSATRRDVIGKTEANGAMSSVKGITDCSATVNGNMVSTSDNDWFELQLPAGAAPPSAAADYDPYVYSSSGT